MEKQQQHPKKHTGALKILKTAKGQIDGIVKMIEDDRYCIDVSTQLLAVISLLKKANTSVVNEHIETCVMEAARTGEFQEKMRELETLMKYIEKSL